jgi:hypothetical protein
LKFSTYLINFEEGTFQLPVLFEESEEDVSTVDESMKSDNEQFLTSFIEELSHSKEAESEIPEDAVFDLKQVSIDEEESMDSTTSIRRAFTRTSISKKRSNRFIT